MPHIYQADIYCDSCGEEIRQRLPKPAGDETTYDSDEYPKTADFHEASDCPQHCGSGADCLEAIIVGLEKVGAFCNDALTAEGIAYVRAKTVERPTDLTALWWEHYGIEMFYVVKTPTAVFTVRGLPRLTFRQILDLVGEALSFPLYINDYKVLERDNLDRTLPAWY